MVDTTGITQMIEPSLTAMGYRIVRVVVTSGRRSTLQVMAERVDDVPMTVDDCATISRSVSALLDVADPIAGAYTLEISSPGVERPLKKAQDFERFTGQKAKIVVREPVENQRAWIGVLAGFSDGRISLDSGAGKTVSIPLDQVQKAHLKFEW